MTTLAQAEAMVARDLRDAAHTTFSLDELDDLIGQGIDALAAFYPKEIVGSVTVSASVYSYALPSGMDTVFRVARYQGGVHQEDMHRSEGDGSNGGWDVFADALWMPPGLELNQGDTLRLYGYGPYTAIDANTATSTTLDIDTTALWAVRVFCRVEGFKRLTVSRAAFEQWRSSADNTDVTALQLAQLVQVARRDWEDEQSRLRKIRKGA